ncbi:DUF6250 domain-containing protein [Pontiella sp.]|uniref:DUF6250 domain-containing protein n=1 Tax=Pontiella sp. TaxID=2837462 RepID=UPI0035696102
MNKFGMAVCVLVGGVSCHAAPLVLGYGTDAFAVGEKLYETDFGDSAEWVVQVEKKGEPNAERIAFGAGMLDLYMPARGCTAWLKKKFSGPIAIVYQVQCPLETIDGDAIQARDINNFWHCAHPGDAEKLFDGELYHGGFGSYSKMQGYYASTGGGGHEGNHTTRFRRYPRELENGDRYPHIALNSRDEDPNYLITPGAWHTVQLVACNGLAQYIVDGKVVYQIKEGDMVEVEMPDKSRVEKNYAFDEFPAYTEGYFGFRLVRTHHRYKNLKVYRLEPK